MDNVTAGQGTYRVLMKVDGTWREMARGFEGLEGATRWAETAMGLLRGDETGGYRIEEMGGRVVCSVEHGT